MAAPMPPAKPQATSRSRQRARRAARRAPPCGSHIGSSLAQCWPLAIHSAPRPALAVDAVDRGSIREAGTRPDRAVDEQGMHELLWAGWRNGRWPGARHPLPPC
jgi:hypothetical protein